LLALSWLRGYIVKIIVLKKREAAVRKSFTSGSKKFWPGLSLAALLMAGLLLTACGDSTATSSPSTTTASSPTTPATTLAPDKTVGVTQVTPTLAAATSAAATTGAAAQGAKSPSPGLLREANPFANPGSLDPTGVGTTRQLLVNIFGGLVTYNEKNEIMPLGAAKWQVSDDGKVYTFTLRSDLKFQNGNPVKASDVVWSLTRSLDPKIKATAASNLTDIAGAEDYLNGKATEVSGLKAKDDQTLEVTLKGPAPYFLAKLTLPIAAILDRTEIEKNERWWEKHTASIGPFILQEWKKGQYIHLAANPYYVYGKPKVDVEFQYVADSQARQALFASGKVDIVWSSGEASFEQIKDDPELSKYLVQPKNLTFTAYPLVLNPKAYAPFKDIKVRQAVAMAIDRKTLVDKVFTSCALPDGIIPPGTIAGYNSPAKALEYNPEKARQLLAEAGYPGGQGLPELVISQAGQGSSSAYMEYFQQQLTTNLGMKVKLEVVERSKFVAEERKKTSLHSFYDRVVADYLDPQGLLTLPLSSKSTANIYGYESDTFDQLVTAADSELNASKRFDLYAKAEQQAITDAVWVPICQIYTRLIVKPYVTGYNFSPLGIMPYDKVEIR
jgi:oligopeptide transport system substrate-binding protein